MHESNVFDRLMAADQRRSSIAKNKVLEYVARQFMYLDSRDVFEALDANLMEQVVSCMFLVIRSELDVLRVIVKWLKSPKRRKKKTDTEDERSVVQSSEEDGKLTRHVNINCMNSDDLQELRKLSNESNRFVLSERCRSAIVSLPNVSKSSENVSISANRRVAHERDSLVFFISYRFDFSSWNNDEKEFESPWIEGWEDGDRWQLKVETKVAEYESEYHDILHTYSHYSKEVGITLTKNTSDLRKYRVQFFLHNCSMTKLQIAPIWLLIDVT